MKILHLMLSNFYVDNYNYQENALPRQNKIDGNDVRIIASCASFDNDGKGIWLKPSEYINEYGINVTRLPLRKLFNWKGLKKIRTYPGVYNLIKLYKPDIIFFHGCSAWELLTVAKYKKHHPEVKFYVDNHADKNNSGSSVISLWLLHKLFYKIILKKSLPYIDRLFYISLECGDFIKEVYSINEKHLEFFPLGGNIINKDYRVEISKNFRIANHIKNEEIIFLHAGKLNQKKKTNELVHAFNRMNSPNFYLYIIGSLDENIKDRFNKLVNSNPRIKYLGWKNPDEINEYLCISDVYIQPGSQSAILQNAICAGNAVIVYPYKSHSPYVKKNGYFVKNDDDIYNVLKIMSECPNEIDSMKEMSIKIAADLLDYKKLAKRLYL